MSKKSKTVNVRVESDVKWSRMDNGTVVLKPVFNVIKS